MPIDSIALSGAARTSLMSLQRTEQQSADRQSALSSGKRVNSVRDDAVAFLAARALSEQASDLAAVKDRSSTGISTVGAAIDGATTVDTLLGQLRGIAQAAQGSDSATERAAFADQFNTVRAQIDQVVGDSSYQGTNLLNAGSSLNAGNVAVAGRDSSSAGLGLPTAATDGTGFTDPNIGAGNGAIEATLTRIDAAAAQIRATQAALGSSISAMTIQADHAQQLGNVAAEAGLRLTQADQTEEAAALTASRTRQQLSRVTMTIGRQQQASILSLF